MEYQSSRFSGGEMFSRDSGLGIHPASRYHSNLCSSSVGRFSSRENSPAAIGKQSSETSSSILDASTKQTAKEKQNHRRFNLFRRKSKSNENNQQQEPAHSSGDETDSSSSLSSSSNNVKNSANNNNNNNYLSNSLNRNSLLSTLSRKCSKKFRNLTSDGGKRDKNRIENNCQIMESSQNGSLREPPGEVISNHAPSGGFNDGVNNVKQRQQKADGRPGKFDLFSSCRKVPGSPRESLDSISRRVRKDALKARVEAQREQQYPDSSSDDEEQFTEREPSLRRYHSDESLHGRWLGDRQVKGNRTERYYRRKVKDDDSSSKCDDTSQQSKEFVNNPTYVKRNLTIGGTHFSASPCSSPQPRLVQSFYQRVGKPQQQQQHCKYSKYEEIKSQSTQYSSVGAHTSQKNKQESFVESVVSSGYLPVRRTNNNVVEGPSSRAPTPPLRSQGNLPKSRPQSFNFDDAVSGGRNAWGNGSTVTSGLPGAATTVVMSSFDSPVRQHDSTRPLSFTSTSHVVYNHNVPKSHNDNHNARNYVENGDRNRGLRSSVSPEAHPAAYMSDSQILGRSRSSKTYETSWRKQSQQLSRNFNSVPKPWNNFDLQDENYSSQNSLADASAISSRPPPSPVRNLIESFAFGSGTSNNGPLSPKYSSHLPSKDVHSLRNHPPKVQTGRKHRNEVNEGSFNDYTSSMTGRPTLATSPPPPLPPTRKYFRQQQSRSSNLESVSHHLGKLVNGNVNNGGSATAKNKLSDNHLEDALLELEKIYHSMKNDDDDARTNVGRRNSTCEELLLHSNWTKNRDEKESNSEEVSANGLDSYNTLEGRPRSAQGNRSAVFPNKITDDLAYRKIARQSESGGGGRSGFMATGSYLLRSPALSPSVSADDVRTFTKSNSSHEPDTVLDDLSFRNLRDANLQKVIEPQPPFGIPLGPISNASSTDYMHAQAQDLSRPKMRRRFRPDVVKDDLAYRNLRKDGTDCGRLNFDELDSILSSEFQEMISTKHNAVNRNTKSLSANLSQIISQNKLLGSSSKRNKNGCSAEEKSSSVSDLRSANENHVDGSRVKDVQHLPSLIKGKLKEDRVNNGSSSSTDTLTDLSTPQPVLISSGRGPSAFRPLSADNNDAGKSTNDIWQVRVTVGAEPVVTDIRHSTEQVNRTGGHTLVRPIPLKLDTSRNPSHRVGNVADDAAQAVAKGSPIDEMKLDELLSSLARDTIQPPTVVTCNGQQSKTNGTEKGAVKSSPTETFPALVTLDGNGDMSVRIIFPHLKSQEDGDVVYGDVLADPPTPRTGNRVFKVASGSPRRETPDGRTQKEMSSVSTRTSAQITNQSVDEKYVSRIGLRSPLTLKKDGVSPSERPVNSKRSPAFNTNNLGNKKTAESVNINIDMPDSESQSERIARYKEERRRQLASQFGQWNTKDENSSLGNEPSYTRFSQRAKKNAVEVATNGTDPIKSITKSVNVEHTGNKSSPRPDRKLGNSPTAASNEICKPENNESSPKNAERTSSPVDGLVRLNRATRLRAQARANEGGPQDLGNRSGSFRSKTTFGGTPSKDISPVKLLNRSATPISSSSEAAVNSTHSQPVGIESEGTASDSVTGKLKDKSAKRKSNLNRMGSVDNTPIPSDSGDDSSRRYRRQRNSFADKSSNCSTDGVQSESLKTTRTTRAVQPKTAISPCSSKLGTKSNSTLESDKAGFKSVDVEDTTSESDADRKSSPRHKATIKRPEIPDIFKSKVSSVANDKVDSCSQNLSSFRPLLRVAYSENGIGNELKSSTLKKDDAQVANSLFSKSSHTSENYTNAQKDVDLVKINELKTREIYLLQDSAPSFGQVPKDTKNMGGKLFKDSSNVVESDTSSDGRVTNDVDSCKFSNSAKDHYDPSGNWRLGSSSLNDVYSFDEEPGVGSSSKGSTKFPGASEPVNIDVNLKNRMTIAYGNKDSSSVESSLSVGEASGWSSQSSPALKKTTPTLNYSVTIPVNTDDSSSRSSGSSDLWHSIENEMKTRHVEVESSGNTSAVIILDGSSSSVSPRRKKSSGETELPTKSILKSKEDLKTVDGRPPPIPHSILKRGSFEEATRSRSPEKCSILKKRGSSEESDHCSDSPEIVSILRRKSTEEFEDCSSSELQSILRRKSMLDETEHSRSSEFHSILKKQCSLDVMDVSNSEPKPILKKKFSSEDVEQSEPKPILKKRSSTEEEYYEDNKLKPILKSRRRSGQEDLMEMESDEGLDLRRATRSPVLRFRHLEGDLPSVPNRLSSTGSRHHTSSEEEFVSVPSSPGSWVNASWEINGDGVLLNGVDNFNAGAEKDDVPVSVTSPLPPSKFDEEETAEGETLGKKFSSSSSSSETSDSSTEEEDESEEETEEESSEELPTKASSFGQTDFAKNASVQQLSPDNKITDKLPKERTGAPVATITMTLGSQSVQTASVALIKPPIATPGEKQEKSSPTDAEHKAIKPSAINVKVDRVINVIETNGEGHRSAMKPTISHVNESGKANEEDGEDVTRMSVAERASLFMQKLKSKSQINSNAPSGPTRFVNRRGLQRSQTQPVTVCEVNEASKIAEELVKRQRNSAEYEDLDIKQTVQQPNQANKSVAPESDEDPSKLSLADRVKLFNQKMIEERLPTRKLSSAGDDSSGSPPRERQRRAMASRFKTQPVTSEELEKAQMISSFESQFSKQCDGTNELDKIEESSNLALNEMDDDYKPKGILKKKEDVHLQSKSTTITIDGKGGSFVNVKGDSITKSMESKTAGITMNSKTSSVVTELKSILKMDSFIKAGCFKNAQDAEEHSSSSSDNDDEEESEGISIDVRLGSPNARSRGSTDEESSCHSQSSGSGSSGGRQEQGKRIKNDAVFRRRNAALRKQEERKSVDVQQSQGLSIIQSSFEYTSPALRSVLSGELIKRSRNVVTQRSNTQPLTQMEKDGVLTEIKGGSIADRLAALKASQEEDWKRRLERNKVNEVDGSPNSGEESKIISEKVILLEGSQQEWKRRVEEKDATKFTVAGKMGKVSPPQESPVLERKKKIPKPIRFQSRTCANLPELAKGSPTSPLPPKSPSITRSKSVGDAKDILLEEKSLTRVSIPKPDDEGFSSFFESANYLDKLKSQRIEIHDEAFNQIVSESREFLVQKRSVHVTRRHAGTKNPLKALAAREDIQNAYTETVTGVAEKELKRMRVEQLAKHSDLATSALAGLASTEDFTSVNLRRSSSVINAALLPYKDIMLIQVKGRRHVQCRLVEPIIASLNRGDNFILVTPNEAFNWIGEFSNVIERAKAAEIANIIQTKKDLGYKGNGDVVTFDEEKKTGGRVKRRDFFEHLGGQDDIADPGSPEDDEIYEAAITETNKVYLVEGDDLVPYEKFWGCCLRKEMLKNTEVLVFDFGSEMYVWQGKLAEHSLKKKAVQLAQELWDDGYDYTDCDVNPISPCRDSVPKYGKKRPPWALFSKVNQHMETVLFRSKFLDWPDLERIIQVKRQESESKNESLSDLQPYDAQILIDTKPTEPDFVLENCHLGRGVYYWDEVERRLCNIATNGVKVWHISEFNHSILPLESWGQFHSSDTYVVRWQYRVAVTGRDLTGKVSRHSSLGRERCAYFFWQGRHSTINEKGASALMTVELDEERGPHIRVDQGQETPCFLNLFEGKMITYLGKRGSNNSQDKWRLFVVRGEVENEAHLIELKCSYSSLRKAGIFVLVDCEGGVVYMWMGEHVSNHSKDVARFITEDLVQRRPMEMGFQLGMIVSMKEEDQGSESDEFMAAFDSISQKEIKSFKTDLQPLSATPRLFHMTSVSGSFLVSEVLCSFRTNEHVTAYPFLQSDIYSVAQPAIFVFDREDVIYVWQGWWPETNDENDCSGSAHLRWNVERRLAMETTVNYCNAKGKNTISKAYTVWAGLEPLEFKHCFPEWEDVVEATEQHKLNGRQDGEKKLVADVLAQLKRTRYPLTELKERPLPEGVDPSIMETYLTDDEFEEVLELNRDDFYALPSWKQTNLKKSAGLY